MPEVIMPKMGDAMEEGTLLQWHKADGATVKAGDVIAEIETDKSNVEIEAEDAGVLHIQAQPGAVVAVGKVIATIGDGQDRPLTPSSGGTGEEKKGAASSASKPSPVGAGSPRLMSGAERRAGSPTRSAPASS